MSKELPSGWPRCLPSSPCAAQASLDTVSSTLSRTRTRARMQTRDRKHKIASTTHKAPHQTATHGTRRPPHVCYFPTLGSLPEAVPSPASLPHRPSSRLCASLSQSAQNQPHINLICPPNSMQTCYVCCHRANPTVLGCRCSCHSSFASRLIQRLHDGSRHIPCIHLAPVLADA